MRRLGQGVLARYVSLALSFALMAGPLLQAGPAFAAPDPQAPEAAAPSSPPSDQPPVVVRELTDERTATTKVFELSDGSRRTSAAELPVHFQDEDGAWQDIVTTLVPSDAAGTHEVAANDIAIELGTDASSAPTARITGEDFSLGIDLAGETEDVKVCLGNEATYLGVAEHASLSVEARPDGFKQDVIISSKDAPNSYSFDVSLDGLELKMAPGGVPMLYRPGHDEPAGDLGRLFVYDSAGEGTVGQVCTEAVTAISTGPTGDPRITYTIPQAWLDDPTRVFPVVVDPTATIYNVVSPLRDCPDTFVCVGNPTTSYGSQSYLSVGYGANKETYSFLKFDHSSVPSSAYIDAASLQVYQYTGATNLVRFGKVVGAWSESTTWNTKPSFAYIGSQTPASSAAWLTQGCTDVVRDWRTGAATDYGLSVYENYGETGNHRELRSGDYGTTSYRPRLVIDWHTPVASVSGHAPSYQIGDTVTTTMTVTSAAASSLKSMLMLINYKSGNPSRYRGYLGWFKTDPGSAWTRRQLTDGTYLAYHTGSQYGTDKIEPDLMNSRVTTTAGAKSVAFTFRISEAYGDVQDNDFDTYFTMDAGAGTHSSGWQSQDTNVDVTPLGVASATAETTASAWHIETDANADGTPDPNDTASEGRGSAALSWSAVSGASNYKIKLFDGATWREVATTSQTSWSSAGKGLFRNDSAIASLSAGANPFLAGTGRDLRDDPRAMYRAVTGTDAPVTPNYNFKVVPVLPSGMAAPDSSCATVPVALENRTKRVINSPNHTSHELPEIAGDGARLILDTREIELSATDLSINSFGPAAELSRVYRSKATGTPALGAGWRMSFEQSLEVTGTKAIWTDEAGESYTFIRSGTRWVAPNGLAATLSSGTAGPEIAFDGRRVVGFDSAGRLDFERDGSGNTVDYDIGQDVTITAANGQSIVVDRDGSGAVLSATHTTTAGTREVSYARAADTLTVTRFPSTSLECSTTYSNTSGCVTGVTRPAASESWGIEYAAGDIAAVENVSGESTPAMRRDVSYGVSTATVGTIDGDTFYRMNPTGSCAEASTEGSAALLTKISYDALDMAIRETSPTGRITSRSHDAWGRPVSGTDAEGRVTTSEYNDHGDLIETADAAGSVTVFELDSCGNIVRETKTLDASRAAETTRVFAYDGAAKGRMTRQARRIDATQWEVTTYSAFDDVTGEPTLVTKEDVVLSIGSPSVDLVYVTDYDAFGNAAAEAAPSGVITSVRTFDMAGRELASKDASGVVTNSRYDACGRLVERWRSHEESSAKLDWGTVAYDGAGNPVIETALDALGGVVSTVGRTYDALGREIMTDDSLVSGSATTSYDERGNAVLERAEGATNTTLAATRYEYNAEGEKIRFTEPGATTVSTEVSYTPAGAVASIGKAGGAATDYEYDASGEIAAKYEDVGESADATTTYLNDAEGNTIEQRAPDGAMTVFSYDLLGRQTGARAGTQQLSTIVYNSAGQVLLFKDFDSVTTTTTYDADGNAVLSNRGGLVTTKTFDSCGREVLSSNPDGSSSASYYDMFGRLTRTVLRDTNGMIAKDTSRGYDTAGRLAWTDDAISGLASRMSFGADGQVTTVECHGAKVSTVTVDGAGRELACRVSVGAATHVDRTVETTDVVGRVTRWSSEALSADTAVSYDQVGRVVSSESLGANYTYSPDTGRKTSDSFTYGFAGRNESADYAYTIDSRLASARIGTATTTYAYDAVSGAVSSYHQSGEATVALTYDPLGRVTSVGNCVVSHDSLGRRTQEGLSEGATRTYTWSGERLTGISQPGLVAAYVYDATGQRIRSVVTVGSVTTTTSWTYEGLSLLRLAADRSDGATWSVDYVYDESGRPFAGIYVASDATATIFGIATSDRGDVRELKDVTGASIALYGYDAYGGAAAVTSAPGVSVPATLAAAIAERQPLAYAGYARDTETALYYCSQRYYDPRSFAFVSKDPVRSGGEESAYQYCDGEPVGGVDPSGKKTITSRTYTMADGIRSEFTHRSPKFMPYKTFVAWGYDVTWSYQTKDGALSVKATSDVSRTDSDLKPYELAGMWFDGYARVRRPDGSQYTAAMKRVGGRTAWSGEAVLTNEKKTGNPCYAKFAKGPYYKNWVLRISLGVLVRARPQAGYEGGEWVNVRITNPWSQYRSGHPR